VTKQQNAYVDINPVIVISDDKIVLAKRMEGIVGGGRWHLPGGRLHANETIEMVLRKLAFIKTNLIIEPLYHSLTESLVGIYDDPKRDPREHVISIAFLCKVINGEPRPGVKVDSVKSFSEAETRKLDIAFDHRTTVQDAFLILKKLECSML